MTPQSPKPSMHEVVTGYYVPSSSDLSSDKNIKNGFGATIAIINGGKECNQCSDSTYVGNLGTWEHLKTLPDIDIYDKNQSWYTDLDEYDQKYKVKYLIAAQKMSASKTGPLDTKKCFRVAGGGEEHPKAKSRHQFYDEFLDFFDMPEEDDLTCHVMRPYDSESAGYIDQYFVKGARDNTCDSTYGQT